jgi:hypothetical protein
MDAANNELAFLIDATVGQSAIPRVARQINLLDLQIASQKTAGSWPVLVCQWDFCRASSEHPRATIEGEIVGKFLPLAHPSVSKGLPKGGKIF